MVIVHVLEDLVEPLSHKSPEVIHGPVVKNLIGCMDRPVVIRHHVLRTVDLVHRRCISTILVMKERTYLSKIRKVVEEKL